MITLNILDAAGSFAENKDEAKRLRETQILPALNKGDGVTLDFTGVGDATQSFVHALISEAMRLHGDEVLDRILFKGCNARVREIIETVTTYMQEGLGS